MTSFSFSETSFSKSGRTSQYILGFAQYTQSFRSRSASFWNFMLPGYKIGYNICFIGTRSAISHSVIGALLCTDKTPSRRYWIFNAGYCLHCPLDSVMAPWARGETRWNQFGPYTYRALIQLNRLCPALGGHPPFDPLDIPVPAANLKPASPPGPGERSSCPAIPPVRAFSGGCIAGSCRERRNDHLLRKVYRIPAGCARKNFQKYASDTDFRRWRRFFYAPDAHNSGWAKCRYFIFAR